MKKLDLFFIRTMIFGLTLTLVACQTPVDKTSDGFSAPGEVRPGPKTGKAVLALLKKSRQASKRGRLTTAESHLERAIRIEPRNPTLWLYMAKLRLFADKYKEAINLAKKALALSSAGATIRSAGGGSVRADCWRVIAHANQKQGNVIQAQKAQEKAISLSD